MVRVVLKGVSKAYGEVSAIDNVNLVIEDKEFITILGPSGGGKTTLLRLVAGLEMPDKGEIYFGDKLVNEITARDRNISMVFQSYALFPHMTVRDNIGFPLTIRNTPKDGVNKRVQEVAGLLGISHLLDRKPKQLSGGEQQRVALGRAIIRNPEVFLMDEPLSSVDASMRIAMRTELKKLQKTLGTTLIYVTHDQTEAMTMADKIAVIRNGRLVQIDSPDLIYNSPRDAWVASFIGNPPMNLIPATYANTGKVQLDGVQASMAAPKSKSLTAGAKLHIGVRPEDIEVSRQQNDSKSFQAEVYLLESLGDSTIVDVKLGNSIVKVREKPGFKAQVGDKVFIKFNESKVAIFDAQSGAAIG